MDEEQDVQPSICLGLRGFSGMGLLVLKLEEPQAP